MRKTQSRIYIFAVVLILFLTLLSGCGLEDMIIVNTLPVPDTTSTEPKEGKTEKIRPPQLFTSEQDWEGIEISGYREGRMRPGINGIGKTYDCNDDRVYFLLKHKDGALLCYGTHDSDLLLPLCQNTYCSHIQNFCQAKFDSLGSVCCYDEHVYVSAGSSLYRLNPDGTDRELVIDVMADVDGYAGIENPRLWNGVFSFEYIPQQAAEESVPAYYLLDGNMNKPQLMPPAVPLYNDGNTFLVYSQAEGGCVLCSWNPYSNSLKPLKNLSTPALLQVGCWGSHARFYLRDQAVYKGDYETGNEELVLDTGLQGDLKLFCFPDCLLLCQDEELGITIRIFDWNQRALGSVTLPNDVSLDPAQIICGESRDRIYLAFYEVGKPDAYLDKYDFGKEKVSIHWLQYHLPEMS